MDLFMNFQYFLFDFHTEKQASFFRAKRISNKKGLTRSPFFIERLIDHVAFVLEYSGNTKYQREFPISPFEENDEHRIPNQDHRLLNRDLMMAMPRRILD